jgi:hypothetical protein
MLRSPGRSGAQRRLAARFGRSGDRGYGEHRQRCPTVAWLLLSTGDQPSSPPFFEPIAFAADVDGRRVMEQSVQDGRRDNRISEDAAPFAVALHSYRALTNWKKIVAPVSSSGR